MRGIFVTGTDTGVGKTVACAALLHRFAHAGELRYWKPIQTGIDEDDDTATVIRLSGGEASRALDEGIRLQRPLSPHLSARLAGVSINLEDLVEIAMAQPPTRRWIVEGAGGILVPVNARDLMADLIARLAIPAVIVARSGLGTINHTLLTIEALRARTLSVAGVIMVGEPNRHNRSAIEEYGGVAVVGEIPILSPLTPAAVATAAALLDPAGIIAEVSCEPRLARRATRLAPVHTDAHAS